ncbi:MAG: CBS domain-containing protein [Polyangiaceae bacterium]|nr:CBS domain-containing protein [Myxococcales bacterium]MCC6901188.1 CBS domain-containing protein [Polyangiaceae bacterium]
MTEGNPESADDRPSIVEEVDPEPFSTPDPAHDSRTHHPPPPPRLRSTEGRPLQLAGDPKLARDLMTRQLFTIEPDAVIASLEEHMAALRFRHLPVVDGEKVVGLISHADLLHVSSSPLTSFAKEVDELVHKMPAKRIMHEDFVTVRPDASLRSVAEEMWNARAGCVLVTEASGALVGIITQGDFLRLAHHLLGKA